MRKPAVNINVFKERRQRLAALIPKAAVVLPAWPEYIRNADQHHNYRVESNLYYLTGFDEPESCLIFRPGQNPETVLFVRPKNVERETWDGFRYGLEGAKQVFGVDQAYDIHDFAKKAPELLRTCDKIYYSLFRNKEFDSKFGDAMIDISGWRPRYGMGLPPIEDANTLVGEMRLRKGTEEVDMMRQAGSISAKAHLEVMKATKPGVSERYLQGIFIQSIMAQNANGEAYGSIVATGNNATTLHYRFNEAELKDGEMFLIDAGADFLNYSGDITRTYPVNGKFSPVQKRLYEKLLKLQKAAVAMVKPGLPFYDLQKFTVSGIVDILLEEKLLTGNKEQLIQSNAQMKYYPHGVSHLLGLDTHDTGILMVRGQPRLLEPGWVLTIEPGIYIPAGDTSVPTEYRGIGIRIEDDVLVTEDGCEVLTSEAPKEIADLESIVGLNYR